MKKLLLVALLCGVSLSTWAQRLDASGRGALVLASAAGPRTFETPALYQQLNAETGAVSFRTKLMTFDQTQPAQMLFEVMPPETYGALGFVGQLPAGLDLPTTVGESRTFDATGKFFVGNTIREVTLPLTVERRADGLYLRYEYDFALADYDLTPAADLTGQATFRTENPLK